eukprot:292067_1
MNCPDGCYCEAVKHGECEYYHIPCDYGVECDYLQSCECTFYHPPLHFEFVDLVGKNKILHHKLSVSNTQNNTLNSKLNVSNNRISSLKHELQQIRAHKAAIQQQNQKRQDIIEHTAQLMKQMQLKWQLAQDAITSMCTQKDTEISRLKQELKESFIPVYKQKIYSLENDISKYRHRYELANNELKQNKNDLSKLNKQFVHLEKTNMKLKNNQIASHFNGFRYEELHEYENKLCSQIAKVRKEIKKRTENRIKCRICYVNDRNILILPCKHQIMCLECYEKLDSNQCPVCKTYIQTKISVLT